MSITQIGQSTQGNGIRHSIIARHLRRAKLDLAAYQALTEPGAHTVADVAFELNITHRKARTILEDLRAAEGVICVLGRWCICPVEST